MRKLATGALVSLVACGRNDSTPPRLAPLTKVDSANSAPSRSQTQAADTRDAHAPAAAAAAEKLSEAEAAPYRAFVERWLTAQNSGDFATYQSLYASTFRGIRRSGKQTHRFNRDGWLKDRAAMFKKPMRVAIDNLVAYRHGNDVQLFFVQDWAQGSYHDHGRKNLVLARGPSPHIRFEELLESKLIDRPVPQPPRSAAASDEFGIDGAPTLPTMRLAFLDGNLTPLRQIFGAPPWTAPSVASFERQPGSVEIGAAVVDGQLGAHDALRALIGVDVDVLNESLQVACRGTIRALRYRVADFIDAPDEEAAVAQASKNVEHTLVGEVDAPCQGAFVRGTEGSPIDIERNKRDSTSDRCSMPSDKADCTTENLTSGPRGYALTLTHIKDSCETPESFRWRLEQTARRRKLWFTEVASGDGEDSLLFVADVNRDGKLDVVTKRGAYVGGIWTLWLPDLRLYWPAGLGCDGCEGDDC